MAEDDEDEEMLDSDEVGDTHLCRIRLNFRVAQIQGLE